jgi:hypothetical protein
MSLLHTSAQWFAQNPLAAATVLYMAGVISVVYTYFELRDQQ